MDAPLPGQLRRNDILKQTASTTNESTFPATSRAQNLHASRCWPLLAVVAVLGCGKNDQPRWREAIEKNQVIRLERRYAGNEPKSVAARTTLPATNSSARPTTPLDKSAAVIGKTATTDPFSKNAYLPPVAAVPEPDAKAPPIIIVPDPEGAKNDKHRKDPPKSGYAVPPPPVLPPQRSS